MQHHGLSDFRSLMCWTRRLHQGGYRLRHLPLVEFQLLNPDLHIFDAGHFEEVACPGLNEYQVLALDLRILDQGFIFGIVSVMISTSSIQKR